MNGRKLRAVFTGPLAGFGALMVFGTVMIWAELNLPSVVLEWATLLMVVGIVLLLVIGACVAAYQDQE